MSIEITHSQNSPSELRDFLNNIYLYRSGKTKTVSVIVENIYLPTAILRVYIYTGWKRWEFPKRWTVNVIGYNWL